MSSIAVEFRDSIVKAAVENGWSSVSPTHFISPNNKYWLKWDSHSTWNIYQRYEHTGKHMLAEPYNEDKKADLLQVIAIEGRSK